MSDIYSKDLTPSPNYEDTNESGQMIYLYVKTHNVTGLKYLGKTVSKDPHKYKGSGLVWRNHCNVHGYNYSTQIIFQSIHKHEIKDQGIYYSQLWDVVRSDEWANLKAEECDGGYCARSFTPEANAKRSQTMKGRPQHPDHTAKVSKALKGRKDTRSPEAKAQAAAKASLKLKGRKMSEEFKQKKREIQTGKPLPEATKLNLRAAWTDKRRAEQSQRLNARNAVIVTCPHCGKSGGEVSMHRHHFDNCVLVKLRIPKTRTVKSSNKTPRNKEPRKSASTRATLWVLVSPQGVETTVTNMREFCRLHNLNNGTMVEVALGNRRQHKGWTVKTRSQLPQ